MRAFLCSGMSLVVIFSFLHPMIPSADGSAPSPGGPPLPLADSVRSTSARDLIGLWQAKHRYGPDVRGTLIVTQTNGGWRAEIAGHTAEPTLNGDTLRFELRDGKNAFLGRFDPGRAKITGQWIQIQNCTSPVALAKYGQDTWRGEVKPLDDTFTFYLMVKSRPDGSIGAFLRNPERNIGYLQYPVDHMEKVGDSVKLFAANKGDNPGRLLAEGKYDAERELLSIYIANRGGTYDFSRVGPGEACDYYPRGRPSVPYAYAPPPAFDDGWPTGSLESVGISRDTMERFIRMIIDKPGDSLLASQIHGVLIARHGKLVLEEYFHGESREKPHDTRSAAKSLTATLIGAAIQAGVPLSVSTPVYQAMNGGTFPPGLEPRKRAVTLEHLITMSSGLDCDDSDPKSPGAEDYVTDESGATDYYQYTLALKMIREPGEKSVYASMSPNLAGGVLKHASGRSLPDLMEELIAQPLQMKTYYLGLTPTGDTYMGGGARFLPRDFMKLGQLHLNGGTWNGHRVLSAEWCRKATFHMVSIGTRKYGYLWWVEEYPYKGRTLRAFFAAGNGGQIVMGIPDLDLVIAFYGGNYGDPALFIPQREYVPKYILPAVDSDK